MPTFARLALTAALLSAPPFVLAQTTPAAEPAPAAAAAAAATDTSARTYTPEDFARYAPRNALDMLEQVPGFVIRAAVQERGLGQATGNVLINGQRLSGKSNDVLTQLSRIPAGNVVRIEIVDGATLDIPGPLRPGRQRGHQGRGHQRPVGVAPGLAQVLHRSAAHARRGLGQRRARAARLHPRPRQQRQPQRRRRPHRHLQRRRQPARIPRRRMDRRSRPRRRSARSWRTTARAARIGNLNASWQKVFFDYVEDGTRTGAGPARPRAQRAVRAKAATTTSSAATTSSRSAAAG